MLLKSRYNVRRLAYSSCAVAIVMLCALLFSGCSNSGIISAVPATSTIAPESVTIEPTPTVTPTVVITGAQTLVVLHTNDVMGQTDACGCSTPKGGVARRAAYIRQQVADAAGAILVVDAGNALLGTDMSLQSEGRVMVEAMNAMNYDAMAVGRLDLALGLDVFQARHAEADFPVLSANLTTTDGKLIFDPYTIVERQGLRIGIIGITDPNLSDVAPIVGVVEALDPTEAVQQYVGELQSQVDVILVLSNLGLEYDKALAEAVPGIDIIVGGGSRTLMENPDQVGDTLIVQQGYLGEWVGKLSIAYDAAGKVTASREEMVALTADIADDADMAALYQKWVQLYPSPTPEPTTTPTPAE